MVEAHTADLQAPQFYAGSVEEGSADGVFSNAVLHWCKTDPQAVARNAFALLKPGGRFAVEMGGFMNLIGKPSAEQLET